VFSKVYKIAELDLTPNFNRPIFPRVVNIIAKYGKMVSWDG